MANCCVLADNNIVSMWHFIAVNIFNIRKTFLGNSSIKHVRSVGTVSETDWMFLYKLLIVSPHTMT